MSNFVTNCNALISFSAPFDFSAFKAKFIFRELSVKSTLECVARVAVAATNETVASIEVRSLQG